MLIIYQRPRPAHLLDREAGSQCTLQSLPSPRRREVTQSPCSCLGCEHHFADALWSPQSRGRPSQPHSCYNLLKTSPCKSGPSAWAGLSSSRPSRRGCTTVPLVGCWPSWCSHPYFQIITLNRAFGPWQCDPQIPPRSALAKLSNERCWTFGTARHRGIAM